MDLIEEARFYWTDQGAGITMDLLPGTIGVLLLLGGKLEMQKNMSELKLFLSYHIFSNLVYYERGTFPCQFYGFCFKWSCR